MNGEQPKHRHAALGMLLAEVSNVLCFHPIEQGRATALAGSTFVNFAKLRLLLLVKLSFVPRRRGGVFRVGRLKKQDVKKEDS